VWYSDSRFRQAIGAFRVDIARSGSVAEQAHRLVSPLRDLFAAMFFFFFGLEIDPASLVPALPFAVGVAALTTVTKVVTGYWAARHAGIDQGGRLQVGMETLHAASPPLSLRGLELCLGRSRLSTFLSWRCWGLFWRG